MTDLLTEYPRRATHDEDGALRAALARRLAEQVYRPAGAAPLPGRLADSAEPYAPPPLAVSVYEEWADGPNTVVWPAIVILDRDGQYLPGPFEVAEDTAWPVDAPEQVALRCSGEYTVDLPVLVMAQDRPTRRALARGVREALEPRGDEEQREGLVLDLGDLFYGLRGRFRLLSMGRTDSADATQRLDRSIQATVRASVRVATPVVLPRLDVRLDPGEIDGVLADLAVF